MNYHLIESSITYAITNKLRGQTFTTNSKHICIGVESAYLNSFIEYDLSITGGAK